MEHYTVNNLKRIENEVLKSKPEVKIIAVSKTFTSDKFLPLVKHGHIHFGENKVQEAMEKWQEIKIDNKNINLHLIGKLQTNKVKFVLPLFDYIHSVDNLKLAQRISEEQRKKNFKPKIFIQINVGEEEQKNGIAISEAKNFVEVCKSKLDLNVIGLMCIPPNDGKHIYYFKMMNSLKEKFNLKELSMGMSNDYMDALDFGASFLRIGSKIFGQRN
tara:strand:+ start:66 stop:713 length:648 start_codon:yes stop_codon:yes gene_type:complete